MVNFDELISFIFTQIKSLLLPGSIRANCTRVDSDFNDPAAFDHDQPSSKYFLTHLSSTQLTLLCLGTLATFSLIGIGIIQTKYIYTYVSERKKRKLLLILAFLFPISAALCLTGMFMPRASTINTSLGLFVFLFAISALIRLCQVLNGGWEQLADDMESRGHRISLMNPPFCCVLWCLPTLAPTSENLRFFELAVSQAPAVKALVLVTEIVAIAEYREASAFWLQLCDTVSLASLLALVYGFHALSRASGPTLSKFSYSTLFRLVDFGLLFFSAQEPLIFENIFVRFGAIGCTTTLNPHDQARFICNFVIILQLLLLSILACIYLRPSRTALFDNHPRGYLSCASTIPVNSEGDVSSDSSQSALIA
jgi:organic solute transporter subunit alpha